MTPARTTAEAYVREKLPELIELSLGCVVKRDNETVQVTGFSTYEDEEYLHFWCSSDYEGESDELWSVAVNEIEIIGHPIQLHHWLRVLVEVTQDNNWMLNARGELVNMKNFGNQHFKNEYLIIGTDRFYQAFCDIVGISSSKS